MRPLVSLFLVVAGIALFSRECWVLAAQDLEVRPVRLAESEGKPLSDAEAIPRLECAARQDLGRADVLVLLGERLERRARDVGAAAEARSRVSA